MPPPLLEEVEEFAGRLDRLEEVGREDLVRLPLPELEDEVLVTIL